ncbi:uncharacterized [Tachysurus ichikawai]
MRLSPDPEDKPLTECPRAKQTEKVQDLSEEAVSVQTTSIQQPSAPSGKWQPENHGSRITHGALAALLRLILQKRPGPELKTLTQKPVPLSAALSLFKMAKHPMTDQKHDTVHRNSNIIL